MRSTRRRNYFAAAAIVLIAAFSAYAQKPRPNFNRAQTFDVQNYTIRASFDRSTKKVFGDTTVSLIPLKADFRVVELDAVGLAFEFVKLDPSGVDLKYENRSGKILITLEKAYGPDDLISIRLKYTATPKQGVYFIGEGEGHSAQIWSQGEAEEARHWFPSFDSPGDKATSEEYLTAEKDETVIGNGEFLGKSENPDGTQTWHFKMPIPHSTYLTSFVIGKYVRIDDKYKEVPLGFYVYPGKEATAIKAFGDTKNMIAVYEELTGIPFPYNKYDQTIVAGFKFGGMENITATTMWDAEVFYADVEFLRQNIVIGLVSHELAHSWFGDLVTCRNWAELWLNEGFATYMEAAYRERVFGRAEYIRKVDFQARQFLVDEASNPRRHALYDLRSGDVSLLFEHPDTTYNKGAAVIHTLREQVGATVFWKAVNIYLNRHKFGNVESTDLQRVMEETSGQDLGWFFDQWVYGAGAPLLDVKRTYSPRTRTLTVTITQTQPADGITPAIFRLPLDITITTASGDTSEKLEVTKRVQSFSFKTTGKPVNVTLDKDLKIPVKRVKMRSLVTVK